ncbi:uncharacterized protein B0H18DRAFT_158211 [Fomitopsis serialis]|uniref:uncharacterized protein n=1 Tax=Fomitopsis serialis TaxID=139415 RepID=UPI0020080234|nr:uncharacterized protein B0H18DRAFT_158211 [Neoantrodia serialis]KAH9913730.1 hypothetical protein B0H18DRAFT_158211 [Neoantrodia serialis]
MHFTEVISYPVTYLPTVCTFDTIQLDSAPPGCCMLIRSGNLRVRSVKPGSHSQRVLPGPLVSVLHRRNTSKINAAADPGSKSRHSICSGRTQAAPKRQTQSFSGTMTSVTFVFMEPKQKASSPGPSLNEAWKRHIQELLPSQDQQRFHVVEARLDTLEPPHSEFDCMVSPANSYGIMDGGFDYYLSEALSPKGDIMALTRCAQAALKARHFGFAPPGTCTLVPLTPELRQNPRFPRCSVLAVCPTMRYPVDVSWHEDLVYNTMWSLLVEVERWNESVNRGEREGESIRKVCMTGLATGVGGVRKEVCARQMILAVKHFLDVTSGEGRKRWAREDFPMWNDVLPIAEDVVRNNVQ